jgi:hypothetical protein
VVRRVIVAAPAGGGAEAAEPPLALHSRAAQERKSTHVAGGGADGGSDGCAGVPTIAMRDAGGGGGGGGGTAAGRPLQERIDAFRACDRFDAALNPIFEPLEKRLKKRHSGSQRWSDASAQDPAETSLFGFARMPSIADVVSGKCLSQMKMELEERADAVALMRPDMLALGQVVQVLGDALHVRLERVAEWLPREGCARTLRRLPEALATLDVRGSLPASELRDALRADQLSKALSYFRPGDSLVMVITKVEAHCDYIGLSMRQSRIDERLSRLIVLGECEDVKRIRSSWGPGASGAQSRSVPPPAWRVTGLALCCVLGDLRLRRVRSFTRDFEHALRSGPAGGASCASSSGAAPAGAPAAGTLDLNELLHGNPLFWNPYALDHMMVQRGLALAAVLRGTCCTRCLPLSVPCTPVIQLKRVQESYCISEDARLFGRVRPPRTRREGRGYLELRGAQNAAWAQDSVRKGVQHASDRNYALAIKCYQSAINLVRSFKPRQCAVGVRCFAAVSAPPPLSRRRAWAFRVRDGGTTSVCGRG